VLFVVLETSVEVHKLYLPRWRWTAAAFLDVQTFASSDRACSRLLEWAFVKSHFKVAREG
jgi:hypothetical protein